MSFTIGSLCSGIGGLDLGIERATGGSTLWQCEIDSDLRSVLRFHWPDAKQYDDVRTLDKENLESVDLICMGFPCQDVSYSGNGGGLSGNKSKLWWDCAEVIACQKPEWVVIENVAALRSRGLNAITAHLDDLGYVGAWGTFRSGAARGKKMAEPHVFGCHERSRLFVVARNKENASDSGRIGFSPGAGSGEGESPELGWNGPCDNSTKAHQILTTRSPRQGGMGQYSPAVARWESLTRPAPEPIIEGPRGGFVLNQYFSEWMMGFPDGWCCDLLPRQKALMAIGNSVQHQVAELAFRTLAERVMSLK